MAHGRMRAPMRTRLRARARRDAHAEPLVVTSGPRLTVYTQVVGRDRTKRYPLNEIKHVWPRLSTAMVRAPLVSEGDP